MDPATIAILAGGLIKIIDRIISIRSNTPAPIDQELIELKGQLRQIAVDAAKAAGPQGESHG